MLPEVDGTPPGCRMGVRGDSRKLAAAAAHMCICMQLVFER